jgi:hypothetical protein
MTKLLDIGKRNKEIQQMSDKTPTPISLSRTAGALPEGVHSFRIVEVEEREGPSEWPYLNVTMEVEEGSDYDGQRVWATVSLSPKARWKLEEFLDAVQAPEEGELYGDDFVGVRVRTTIIHEQWEGQTRARVERFLPMESGGPSSPSTQLSFDTLRKKAKGDGGRKKTNSPPEPDSEDIKLPEDVLGD